METKTKEKVSTVNDIARAPGAGKISKDYYNPRAPHMQPFQKPGAKKGS